MRLALLHNPASGSGRGPSGDELERLVREAGAEVVRLPVEHPERVADAGVERVVVASGDGAIGPAAQAASAHGLPLAVVPLGTANDFARRMRLPFDPRAAARLAARGRALRRLDLGMMGDRPFVNVVAAGLSVAASRRGTPLKPVLGPLAYLAGAGLAGLLERPLRCRAAADGRAAFDGEAWQVMAACAGGFGGGSRVEVADPEDGRLDLVPLPAGPRPRLVRYARGMRAGAIARQPGVVTARGARIDLHLPPGAHVNIDGEVLPIAPALSVRPGWFEVVVG